MNRRYIVQRLIDRTVRKWESLCYVVGVKQVDAELARRRQLSAGKGLASAAVFRAVEVRQ